MKSARTIIACGDRRGQALEVVHPAMDAARKIIAFTHVVVGSVDGTDGDVFSWAVKRELDATVMPAKWRTGIVKGVAAGPIRNARMAAQWPDFLALFAFPGGAGTENMVGVARSLGKSVYRWRAVKWELEVVS